MQNKISHLISSHLNLSHLICIKDVGLFCYQLPALSFQLYSNLWSIYYLIKRGKPVKIVLVVKFKSIVRCSSPHNQQREWVSFASQLLSRRFDAPCPPTSDTVSGWKIKRFGTLKSCFELSENLHLLICFSLKKMCWTFWRHPGILWAPPLEQTWFEVVDSVIHRLFFSYPHKQEATIPEIWHLREILACASVFFKNKKNYF